MNEGWGALHLGDTSQVSRGGTVVFLFHPLVRQVDSNGL